MAPRLRVPTICTRKSWWRYSPRPTRPNEPYSWLKKGAMDVGLPTTDDEQITIRGARREPAEKFRRRHRRRTRDDWAHPPARCRWPPGATRHTVTTARSVPRREHGEPGHDAMARPAPRHRANSV